MLSAIAGVVNAIGKGLKRAEKRIDKVIKKTKVKLQQAESADDKLQTSVQKGKRLGSLATKWQLKTTRLWLKVLEWLLYFLDLLIKLIMLICSSVIGLLIVVAVILIVFIGTLLQQIGSVGEMESGGISVGEGDRVTNLAGVNWDEALAKAQAMHKTGEFSDMDMCRFQVIYLCYCYAQENPDTLVMPESVIGMSLTETSFTCYQDYTGKDVFVDHSDFYQGWEKVYPGAGAIGPLQLDSQGRGYGDGSEIKKIRGIKHTKESHLGSQFNVDTYIPYAVARTFEATDIDYFINEENKTDTESEGYWMYKAMADWGIEETQENVKFMANMWLYTKHWVPYKFGSEGRWYLGGSEIGGSEKWCEVEGNIICAMFKECGGNLTNWSCTMDIGENITEAWLTNTMGGGIITTGSLKPCNDYIATLNGTSLNTSVIDYLATKYKDKPIMKDVESLLNNFQRTQGKNKGGSVRTLIASPYCLIAGRAITVSYLERLGIDPTALSGGTAATSGGNGAFGLNYYNSDGSVNIEAINTANALLHEFCKPENGYADTVTLPTEVVIIGADGKEKKVKVKGGTYPNFWGLKYNDSVPNNWGQCTWYAKGRAQLWLYENVGTEEEKWRLPSDKMTGHGASRASSMSGWCTVDNELSANCVISRSGPVWTDGSRPGHVVFCEAVDKVNNTYYVSHGNVGRYSLKEHRHDGVLYYSLPENTGSIGSGAGFSYVQALPITYTEGGQLYSDKANYPYLDFAHLDKRK